MQALKLEAQYGLRWIIAGWRMFRKQPFSFMALLVMFWLLLLCASALIGFLAQGLGSLLPFVSVDLIAAIGSLLFAALTPALTVGFLQACRVADNGLTIHPVLLFAPFRAGKKTVVRLLSLGMIQMVALVLILLVTSGTDALRPQPAPAQSAATAPASTPSATTAPDPKTQSNDGAAPTAADEEEMRRKVAELTEQGLAYLPVALIMWYAPMLVAWHRLPVGKSLFFSLIAVWRNRTAFIVYGVAWLVIWMTTSVVLAIVGAVIGIGNVAALVVAPLAMLLLTCMYCSMYQTYATVFVEAPPDEEPVIPA
jgi:uncharacterized membrane protein